MTTTTMTETAGATPEQEEEVLIAGQAAMDEALGMIEAGELELDFADIQKYIWESFVEEWGGEDGIRDHFGDVDGQDSVEWLMNESSDWADLAAEVTSDRREATP